jgi:hypothetical protein
MTMNCSNATSMEYSIEGARKMADEQYVGMSSV